MLLDRITVVDIGLFRGRHVIELAPRKKYGSARSVILVGGLNGAGKTTILTAVRTALYGRQSLGFGAPQKAYEEFLEGLIHKSKSTPIPTNAASISLEFSYSQLGRQSHFVVTRSWEKNGRRLDEALRIVKDGKPIEGLTQEQAQAFLNQLIPIGVSELFFFDGEKIAHLASEGGEVALSSSIRRLLGLDVLDKLKADLTIYSRQHRGRSSVSADQVELASLQAQLDTLKQEADTTTALLNQEIVPSIDRIARELDHLEGLFRASGGAWAVSRESLKARVNELVTEKDKISSEIRNALNGAYPLALASDLAKKVTLHIAGEQESSQLQRQKASVAHALEHLRGELKKTLSRTEYAKAEPVIAREIAGTEATSKAKRKIAHAHGLGDVDASRVMETLKVEALSSLKEVERFRLDLDRVESELAELGERLAQAPAEGTLSEELEKIRLKSEELGRLRAKKQQLLEETRSKLWAAIDVNRKLRRLEKEIVSTQETSVGLERAGSTIALLDDFSAIVTKRKVEMLRKHFAGVFSRLARKEDLIVDALIDDATFEVTLIGKGGERIPKQSLSAGERQIYAIAMLEALAKTSGRSLPIIIDTPLGRLDGPHRRNLVNNYFPHASHQVIILSTDTEVDERFYQDLSRSISHALHLNYDEAERMTTVEEGYFWKHQDQELRHVS